jgi:regulator of replication initiation timing
VANGYQVAHLKKRIRELEADLKKIRIVLPGLIEEYGDARFEAGETAEALKYDEYVPSDEAEKVLDKIRDLLK